MTRDQYERRLASLKQVVANAVVNMRACRVRATRAMEEMELHADNARNGEQRIQAFIEENRGLT